MSTADTKKLYRRLIEEVFNQQNLDVLGDIVTDDFVDHDPIPGQAAGWEGLRAALADYFAAFPDMSVTIDHLVAEDDLIAAHGSMHGTHQGPLLDIPPTGKAVTLKWFDLARVENGKFAERWGADDTFSMMQQLGILPGAE